MAIATGKASDNEAGSCRAEDLDLFAERFREEPIATPPDESLRILFLVSAHNGLSQRAWITLTDLGHEVGVAVVGSAEAMEAAVAEHDPQLIVCPFLKRMIPASIWSTRRCLIVRSTGMPTAPTRSCARSAPAKGILAYSTPSTERSFISSAPTPRRRCTVARGRSSRGGRVRSVAPPPTERCGSRTSSGETRRPSATSSCRRRAHSPWPVSSSTFRSYSYRSRVTRLRTTRIREITYTEHASVGYLHFDFYNGAMSTEQCDRLRDAYSNARSRRETRVIVLMGGRDYFSNGIHLNMIEAAEDPAAESWRNLNAIDDLVRDIVETDSHLVISALAGDAGAGGVPLALAADYAVGREDVVLNPFYRHMGGLYGSEYWTYLLPRRVGPAAAARLTAAPFRPVGTSEAVRMGLVDAAFGADLDEFRACTARLAERIAHDGLHHARLLEKRRRRAADERVKPLQAYRDEELARCHDCFFGPDRAYHEARRRFVYKLGVIDVGGPRSDAAGPDPEHSPAKAA